MRPITKVICIGLVFFMSTFLASFEAPGTAPVKGSRGMVVSVDSYATRVGLDILKRGGNAVDAAVAVGLALAVTYPAAGNIGGGGFMMIRMPDTGESIALDFREKAPGRATPDMYLDGKGRVVRNRSYFGHLAVGVPGTVRGFEAALKKYGCLDWKEVMMPAVRLAEKGFQLSAARAESFNRLKKRFKGNREFFKVFSKADGSSFKAGDVFTQPDLARSLRLLADEGPDAFYKGEIADMIVADMQKHGGLISREDLNLYRAREREPVFGSYRGFEIISMPPPSSGGSILIEMLNILEGYRLDRMERTAADTLHLMGEIMKFAYLDRARFMGDADFEEIPVKKLISKAHAREIREKIDLNRAVPSAKIGEDILVLDEAAETTHYSVIDKSGLAVATTYTLNGGFGSGVVAEGTGILLNNEMADFNMKPGYTNETGLIGTAPNTIRPHKRMLSSMCPTFVVKDGWIWLITGSPGGRTIINTVFCVIVQMIDFKLDVQAAVDAPRMHHPWMPDILGMEKGDIPEKTFTMLKSMGHDVRNIAGGQGDAHSIWIDPATGAYHGAADKRSQGTAAGY